MNLKKIFLFSILAALIIISTPSQALQNYSFGILISDASSGDLAVNINGDIYSVNRNYDKVSIYAPDPYGSNNYKLSKQWNFDGNQSTGGGDSNFSVWRFCLFIDRRRSDNQPSQI